MEILVVYDTQSVNRNTEKVAKTLSEVLKEKGHSVDCFYVKDVDPLRVKDYDAVLAGSPTHVFRATNPITDFLGKFSKGALSGKAGAAFDTQVQGRITGNAAKGIEKRLRKAGCRIVAPPLVVYVEGKIGSMTLKAGELEKVRKYAEDLSHAFLTDKENK